LSVFRIVNAGNPAITSRPHIELWGNTLSWRRSPIRLFLYILVFLYSAGTIFGGVTLGDSVLIPDARAQGNSTGLASYGLMESDDIHRWVDWIETVQHPRCMFGLGESMGAAQLLQSLPKEPRFCAVVAESSFATFREVAYARFGRPLHTGPWIGRTFFRSTVDVGFLYVRLRYGLNMEDASPERAVAGTRVPVLLIHGLRDRNIPPYHSDLIQAKNPSAIVVWKVPGAVHTGAHKVAPEEFERRVLQWFANHTSTAR
jgi:pimeloyl-ACP methyl ester carboxylesterase